MEANAVFQGGGVKGIGLAGAVSEAERRGIRFRNVAGTSSGAIIAALISAGYTGKEMRKLIIETPFTSLLKRSWYYDIKWIGPALRLFTKKGMFSGDPLENWMKGLLEVKGVRSFADLPAGSLKVVASDITQGKLLVLPDDLPQYGLDPSEMLVASAVRMSASLPFFFEPVFLDYRPKAVDPIVSLSAKVCIVDGGLLSNFPLWLFDPAYRGKPDKRLLPTLGFQLVGRGIQESREIRGPIDMLEAMFSTMADAHDDRYIEKHNRFRTVKIPTLGVGTTQFDIKPEMSLKLYEAGERAGTHFFENWTIETYWKSYQEVYGC